VVVHEGHDHLDEVRKRLHLPAHVVVAAPCVAEIA